MSENKSKDIDKILQIYLSIQLELETKLHLD